MLWIGEMCHILPEGGILLEECRENMTGERVNACAPPGEEQLD
jgi:hypothetical protein